MQSNHRPIIYAGPCMAESLGLMDEVAERMTRLAQKLDFEYIFKASFDKANRTSIDSYRGPGLEQALSWFGTLKEKYNLKVLTDIHETHHASACAPVVDVLQIPAFLCRQTDLLVAAAKTGRIVNIKKGQMVSPEAMLNAVEKIRYTCVKENLPVRATLTERGACFGYGNLVVDMRAFPIMAKAGVPIIFDITHSTQLPALGEDGKSSSGDRRYAPVLARAAMATGYVDGFFLEVHPTPKQAKSDKDVQLNLDQAEILLTQICEMWDQCRSFRGEDKKFLEKLL